MNKILRVRFYFILGISIIDFLKIVNFVFFAETATVDTTLIFVQRQCEEIINGYKLAEMKNGRTSLL